MRAPRSQIFAVVVACLALFVAMGGPSTAAKLINGKHIKNNSIAGKKIKNNSITGKKIKKNSLTTSDIAPGQVAKALKMVRVVAAPGADENAGRANAKPVVLHRAGPLSLYAKCFNNEASDRTVYEIYVGTTANGSAMTSRYDELHGGPASADFLNSNTPETDRIVERDYASTNQAYSDADDSSDFSVIAPGGAWMRGWSAGFVKRGDLPGGNGVYGAGNVCLFHGVVASSN